MLEEGTTQLYVVLYDVQLMGGCLSIVLFNLLGSYHTLEYVVLGVHEVVHLGKLGNCFGDVGDDRYEAHPLPEYDRQ